MLHDSSSEESFSTYSALGSAAHFLVISSEEQAILDQIPGWQTPNVLPGVQQSSQEPSNNQPQQKDNTSERNLQKDLGHDRSLENSSLSDLIASVTDQPLLPLRKHKSCTSLRDVHVHDNEQCKSKEVFRQQSDCNECDSLTLQCSKSLENIHFSTEDTKRFEKGSNSVSLFRATLLKSKERVQLMKEKLYKKTCHDMLMSRKMKMLSNAIVPQQQEIVNCGETRSTGLEKNSADSQLLRNKPSTASDYQLLGRNSFRTLKKKAADELTECTSNKAKKFSSMNGVVTVNNTHSVCGHLTDRLKDTTSSLDNRTVSERISSHQIVESNTCSHTEFRNELIDPPRPLNATYTIDGPQQNINQHVQGGTEPFSYEVGEETQRACLGITGSLNVSSQDVRNEVCPFQSQNFSESVNKVVSPVIINLHSSEEIDTHRLSETLHSSNELFNSNPEVELANNNLAVNSVRRKLVFPVAPPTTPVNCNRLPGNRPTQVEETSPLPEARNPSQHNNIELESDNIFSFTPSEIKMLTDILLEFYS